MKKDTFPHCVGSLNWKKPLVKNPCQHFFWVFSEAQIFLVLAIFSHVVITENLTRYTPKIPKTYEILEFALWYKFTVKDYLFIILIDSLYLQESAVQRKNEARKPWIFFSILKAEYTSRVWFPFFFYFSYLYNQLYSICVLDFWISASFLVLNYFRYLGAVGLLSANTTENAY